MFFGINKLCQVLGARPVPQQITTEPVAISEAAKCEKVSHFPSWQYVHQQEEIFFRVGYQSDF